MIYMYVHIVVSFGLSFYSQLTVNNRLLNLRYLGPKNVFINILSDLCHVKESCSVMNTCTFHSDE